MPQHTDPDVQAFFDACLSRRDYDLRELEHYLVGASCWGQDRELLLQAHFYFNPPTFLGADPKLLLFEQAPVGRHTDLGKSDFVYFSDSGHIYIVETKYIDTDASGPTAKKRRNKHRNKVIEQAQKMAEALDSIRDLPKGSLRLHVCTTDPSLAQRLPPAVTGSHVTTGKLQSWRQAIRAQTRQPDLV